jgi:hypothetical protein
VIDVENAYPLLNVSGKARMGCYATFPGTGPHGSKCSGCIHQAPDKSRFVCAKFRVLTGRKGSPIDPSSPACRYFAARPAFNAAR